MSMTDHLVVLLEGKVAGLLTPDKAGYLRFEYDDEYRRDPNSTLLSRSMPKSLRRHDHPVVAPWLANLLPDDPRVIEGWARHFHILSTSVFEMLSTRVGEDCAGAVQLVQPNRLDELLAAPGRVEGLTNEALAERVRDLTRDPTGWLGRTFSGSFSLGGAQTKTALLWQSGRWRVPSGSTPTTHIIKPAIARFEDHELNEHLCLEAARRCGIAASRSPLLRSAAPQLSWSNDTIAVLLKTVWYAYIKRTFAKRSGFTRSRSTKPKEVRELPTLSDFSAERFRVRRGKLKSGSSSTP